PTDQIAAISERVHGIVSRLYENWRVDIEPGLARTGISLLEPADLNAEQRAVLQARFSRDVWPVLTPLAVDQGHPFPTLRNRSINLAILLHKERQRVSRRPSIIAVVQVPSVLPRLVDVPTPQGEGAAFLLLEALI